MNKKGFTLIELIAVIVIMGMLLMIVLPATGRIMASNDKREYDEYYRLVKHLSQKKINILNKNEPFYNDICFSFSLLSQSKPTAKFDSKANKPTDSVTAKFIV